MCAGLDAKRESPTRRGAHKKIFSVRHPPPAPPDPRGTAPPQHQTPRARPRRAARRTRAPTTAPNRQAPPPQARRAGCVSKPRDEPATKPPTSARVTRIPHRRSCRSRTTDHGVRIHRSRKGDRRHSQNRPGLRPSRSTNRPGNQSKSARASPITLHKSAREPAQIGQGTSQNRPGLRPSRSTNRPGNRLKSARAQPETNRGPT